ncbi:TonB-dependent receptor [Altererythrobacter sp. GH1-8]|uniref:TonB-dependent receptor n=1 Tax=Altererythrobacter sp. GH1-8 TaxID=3349333 RepID=UPI00374D1088
MSIYRNCATRGAFSARFKLGVATAALCVSGAAFAQDSDDATEDAEAQQANASQTAPAPAPAPAPASAPDSGNVIIVSGIRASLEDAISQRRNADVILDGISADDIGNIPDLNLGEALQRIPGVQIDRDQDRRSSGISVRGLPSTFTRITVMGQDIASPSSRVGRSNPFGAFDSSIFNGANVIKSFTADTISGGLGANVDLRLNSALKRKDGQIALRAELGYEETAEAPTPAFFGSVSKHFADHTIGVYATAAYSKQRFRRDSVQFNNYQDILPATGDFTVATNPELQALVRGLDPDTAAAGDYAVFVPGSVRQFTEQSGGYRLSAASGIEFRPSENLSLRVDGIFTRRDLDDNLLDDTSIDFPGGNGFQTAVRNNNIRPIGGPQSAGVQDGVAIYYFPNFNYVNPNYTIQNRTFNIFEQTWAIYPQINFDNGTWKIDLTGTYSKAQNRFTQEQFRLQVRTLTGITDGNGITGEINTGNGDISDFLFTLDLPDGSINFVDLPTTTLSGAGTSFNFNRRAPGGGANSFRNVFLLAANNQSVDRDLKALELSIERKLNFGPFTVAKVGARYQEDDGLNLRQNNSLHGAQVDQLDDSILRLNSAITSGGTFFGGIAPGFNSELLSLDISRIRELILPIDPARLPADTAPNFLGDFYQSTPITNVAAFNWISDRQNFEAYAMGKFDLAEISQLDIRGNFGVRYVNTKLGGNLLPIINGDGDVLLAEGARAETKFDEFLPSANLIWDVAKNLVLHAAYYHTFESLNLSEFNPAPDAYVPSGLDEDGSFGRLRVNASDLDREPRTSKAMDLGLTWYNRRGSLIGINLFRKKVTSDYIQRLVCPSSFTTVLPTAVTFNNLTLDSSGQCLSSEDVNVQGNAGDAALPAGSEINISAFVPLPANTIRGLEAQIQQDLSFLSSPFWSGFGAQANLSLVTAKEKLYGVSKYTYNLIGYWENKHFAVRLARNTRGPNQIASGGSFQGNERTTVGRSQLDGSIRVSPVRNFDIRLEAFNITNVVRRDYEFVRGFTRRNDYDGRTYALSVQVKF